MAVNVAALASGLEAAYTDAEWRQMQTALVAGPGTTGIYSGVRPGGSTNGALLITANGTPNNQVFAAPGPFYLQGSVSDVYIGHNDTAATLTVPAAHATLLRKDAVVLNPTAAAAVDRILYVAGTPGGGSYPTATSDQYKLANVDTRSVAVAGGTVIRPADIFDQRTWTASPGGVIVCSSTTRPTSPHPGLVIFETDTLALKVWDASGWRVMNVDQVVTAATRPASPVNGQRIFETDSGLTRVWRSDQSRWQAAGGDVPSTHLRFTDTGNTANTAWVVIPWRVSDWEDGGNFWDAVTNPSRVLAPVDGIYRVTGTWEWVTNAFNQRAIEIWKNSAGTLGTGTQVVADSRDRNPNGNTHQSCSQEVSMTAGDYCEMFVRQDSGGNLAWQTNGMESFTMTFIRDKQ